MFFLFCAVMSSVLILSACESVSSSNIQKNQSTMLITKPPIQAPPIQEADDRQLIFNRLDDSIMNADLYECLTSLKELEQKTALNKRDKDIEIAIEKATPLLKTVSIICSDPPHTIAGKSFANPFIVQILQTGSMQPEPLRGIPVTVFYPVHSQEGEKQVQETVFNTDDNGVVAFLPPIPQHSADTSITFAITPFHNTVYNQNMPKQCSISVQYQVETSQKKIPTIITVLDYDEAGKPLLSKNLTATKILTGLLKHGFTRVGLDEYSELAGSDESVLIKAAEQKIKNSIERLIFGKTTIRSITQSEPNTWVCTIVADISVWHFAAGKKTNHFMLEYTAKAGSKQQALIQARSFLGEYIIAKTCRFNL